MKWIIKHIPSFALIFFLQACGSDPKSLPQHSLQSSLLPPVILSIDSIKPVTTLLDTASKPKITPFPLYIGNSLKDDNTRRSSHTIKGLSRFTSFAMADGLGLNTVTCGTMDHYGNLWFGHDGAGATRYDGKTFTTFTKAQGLASNYVNGITEDKEGNLLFITGGDFVSRFDGKRFSQFGKTIRGIVSATGTYQSIITDRSGNLWFASEVGLSKFDGKSYTFYTIADGLPSNTVNAICEDRSGKIWIGTQEGVSCYNGKRFSTFTKVEGLVDNDIGSIVEDRLGQIWFGTYNSGVSCYDGKKFKSYKRAQGLISDSINCIKEDKSGNLWFGTTEGACRFDGANFTSFTVREGLSCNYVSSIIEDKSGSLWFGTFGGGICRYDGLAFTVYSNTHGLIYNQIASIAEDNSGNLWLGSAAGGVSRFDGKKFITITWKDGVAGADIKSISPDHAGNLWFAGSNGGVTRYDGKNLINYTTQQGLSDNTVWAVMEDKDQHIWMGAFGGISRFNGKSITTFKFPGLFDEIIQDRSGNIWCGAFNGGLLKYDGKSFATYGMAQGLPDNDVRCIAEDKNGNLWIGTALGVCRFDGKTFDNLSTTEGLDDNNVWDIIKDSKGNLYILTNVGITELPAAALSLPFSKIRDSLKHYCIGQGYPISSPFRNSMYCDKKDILWIGTGYEKTPLIRFDPAALPKRNNVPPSLIIQQIKIDDQNICWSDLRAGKEFKSSSGDDKSILLPANITEENLTFRRTLSNDERESMKKQFGDIHFDSITSFYLLPLNLQLPQTHNNISFDFNATEVAYPNLVNYQYILEGYSKDWSPVTKNTTALFGNMREGNYVFRLKAQGPNGIWSEPVTYSFTVLPPWWRTWWAYTIYVLIFLAALRVFSKWREKNLRHEKEKLEATVEKRTKELNESIETLKSTQSQLIQSEKMASLGELTAGIAHEIIQNPLNFVNNFSEINTELVNEMQQEMDKGNYADAKTISNDIKENELKINIHGKRADAIVKGMLQHSRSSTGAKEPTDINALADEYLRLSYHGLRAKNKDFNATMKTEFDESIGKINIIPQDIGRVLLNLYNNAFYAVNEKKKIAGNGYEPVVSVSTKKINDKVEIKVKDNGNGIPQNIVDKIFQPFFTTKPTGQGTGLGLSLSYDIVKAHGGELSVETEDGEGSAFIIKLPV